MKWFRPRTIVWRRFIVTTRGVQVQRVRERLTWRQRVAAWWTVHSAAVMVRAYRAKRLWRA